MPSFIAQRYLSFLIDVHDGYAHVELAAPAVAVKGHDRYLVDVVPVGVSRVFVVRLVPEDKGASYVTDKLELILVLSLQAPLIGSGPAVFVNHVVNVYGWHCGVLSYCSGFPTKSGLVGVRGAAVNLVDGQLRPSRQHRVFVDVFGRDDHHDGVAQVAGVRDRGDHDVYPIVRVASALEVQLLRHRDLSRRLVNVEGGKVGGGVGGAVTPVLPTSSVPKARSP